MSRQFIRSKSLKWQLIALVLTCVLPTVAAAVGVIFYAYTKERAGLARGLAETTRALALVVDREIAAREGQLKLLAQSPSLSHGDLAGFHEFARAIAPSPRVAILLADKSGHTLLNSRRPFGAELPDIATAAKRRTVDAAATLVTDIFMTPLGQQYGFTEPPRDSRRLVGVSQTISDSVIC